MNYMYSTSASNGQMTLTVDFALGTNANTDQILAQMRQRPGELAAAQRGDQLAASRCSSRRRRR